MSFVSQYRPSYPAIVLGLLSVALAAFVVGAQPFLSQGSPIDADVMVIEGWLPADVLHAPARELKAGRYVQVFVSGLIYEKGDENYSYVSDAARISADLVDLGVNPRIIEPCPTLTPAFNRTSHMARAVRDRMRALGLKSRGILVVTLGSHARQSLLAYQRMLSGIAPVGIVSYPDPGYDAARWWASRQGVIKTTKDFAGWLKEAAVGLRS